MQVNLSSVEKDTSAIPQKNINYNEKPTKSQNIGELRTWLYTHTHVHTHYACQHGDVNEVESIVVNGAKVNAPDRNGRVSMHYACMNIIDSSRMIPFLIKEGAKVDSPDGDGRLPIHYACEHGDLDVVKSLVTNGAKLTVRDGDGRLPVDYASKNEEYDKELETPPDIVNAFGEFYISVYARPHSTNFNIRNEESNNLQIKIDGICLKRKYWKLNDSRCG
ncbi:cyclin-dependent kinase inhibitor 2A-like [Zophobas morio]|uniref:cyclin-dependent kinase inhibitor 2A-like n=1 Tax=Zophobas morio TaxID=2755281 RepID=UPI003083DE2C